jgi:hypothetical protein
MKSSTLFLIALFAGLILVGCITSSVNSGETRVAVVFTAVGTGQNLFSESEEDSILVTEFKFSIDRFNIYAEEDLVLQTSDETSSFIFSYTTQSSAEQLVIDVGLGFEDVNEFNGYKMFIEPVESRDAVLDDDFFGDGENYSLIMKGSANGRNFTIRSSKTFEKLFDFDVELGSDSETLIISKFIDLNELFFTEEGELINPTVQENRPEILTRFEELIQVTARGEVVTVI